MDAFAADIERMHIAAAGLAAVTATTTHGTPSLKVGKMLLARLREPGVLAVYCRDEAEKFLLIEAAPDVYFTTPHFDGYAMVLVRMGAISDDELKYRMRIAWEVRATPTVRKMAASQAFPARANLKKISRNQ